MEYSVSILFSRYVEYNDSIMRQRVRSRLYRQYPHQYQIFYRADSTESDCLFLVKLVYELNVTSMVPQDGSQDKEEFLFLIITSFSDDHLSTKPTSKIFQILYKASIEKINGDCVTLCTCMEVTQSEVPFYFRFLKPSQICHKPGIHPSK